MILFWSAPQGPYIWFASNIPTTRFSYSSNHRIHAIRTCGWIQDENACQSSSFPLALKRTSDRKKLALQTYGLKAQGHSYVRGLMQKWLTPKPLKSSGFIYTVCCSCQGAGLVPGTSHGSLRKGRIAWNISAPTWTDQWHEMKSSPNLVKWSN